MPRPKLKSSLLHQNMEFYNTDSNCNWKPKLWLDNFWPIICRIDFIGCWSGIVNSAPYESRGRQLDYNWLAIRHTFKTSQLALRRWPNVGIGRHRRDRQPTSRQRWYSVACVATVCWHSVGARRLAYRSLPMFCVWTSVVGIKCFSNKCCRSTRLSIHQLHI